MAVDQAAVAAEIELRLKLDPGDAADVTEMAVDYIVRDSGTSDDDMLDTDLVLFQGVVLLGMRMFQDTPNTPLTEFNIEQFGGLVQSNVLYKRIEDYWQHLRVNWGVA